MGPLIASAENFIPAGAFPTASPYSVLGGFLGGGMGMGGGMFGGGMGMGGGMFGMPSMFGGMGMGMDGGMGMGGGTGVFGEMVSGFEGLKGLMTDNAYLDLYADKMRQVGNSMDSAGQKGDFLSQHVAPALGNAFQTFFFDVMNGRVKSLEEYLTGFLKSVQQSLIRLLSNKLATWLLNSIGNLFSSSGPTEAGGTDLPGAVGPADSSYTPAPDWGGARGGLLAGGFTPMRAFSAGGVATRPTLGLVGEGRYNEAVVPLPNGTHIPVQFTGGGGGGGPVITQTVIVNNESGQAIDAEQIMTMMKQTGPNQYEQQMIVNIVVDDINTGGPTRDAVKRINAGY